MDGCLTTSPASNGHIENTRKRVIERERKKERVREIRELESLEIRERDIEKEIVRERESIREKRG